MVFHEENQYTQLIHNILENGYWDIGRNGKTKCLFGYNMRFSLKDGSLPLLTTKKVAWKICLHELLWFIHGSTDNRELQSKNVHIWDDNASRQFLDSRGLTTNEENDLGPVYGHQWRHFNAKYDNFNSDYSDQGVDQLAKIITDLKNPETRNSRRHILTAWNPCQLDEMALPPCHILVQFNVREDKYLSCALYQRSGDVGLGVPFNIASYSFFTHILAKHCGLVADEFVYFLGNAHIYEEHIDILKKQLEKPFFDFPKISIANLHNNINDYCLEDIVWETPYVCGEPLKMPMIA